MADKKSIIKYSTQIVRKWGGSFYFPITKFLKVLGTTVDEPIHIVTDDKRKIAVLSGEKFSPELKKSLGLEEG